MTDNELQLAINAAVAAHKAGQHAQAIARFESIVSAGRADSAILIVLAATYRTVKQPRQAGATVDIVLRAEPTNIRALLLKGQLAADQGDTRTASGHFLGALRVAARLSDLPADVREDLLRAEVYCNTQTDQMEREIQAALAKSGRASAGERFDEALQIMFGRAVVQPQKPQYFHFPRLASIPFFDASEFQWLPDLEAQAGAIRDELRVLVSDQSAFQPYVETYSARPQFGLDKMVNNASWSAYYLIRDGEVVAENAKRFPRTMEALAQVPLSKIPGRSPSVLFSRLAPGAHIPPHHGVINTRLIGHLPLIVPEGCEFRVGNERRAWREGKAWLFDDTIEHEAWNRSDQDRYILIFEVWRPELTREERDAVATLFTTVDAHGGEPQKWDI